MRPAHRVLQAVNGARPQHHGLEAVAVGRTDQLLSLGLAAEAMNFYEESLVSIIWCVQYGVRAGGWGRVGLRVREEGRRMMAWLNAPAMQGVGGMARCPGAEGQREFQWGPGQGPRTWGKESRGQDAAWT